jgi:serine/threonine protein kinase
MEVFTKKISLNSNEHQNLNYIQKHLGKKTTFKFLPIVHKKQKKPNIYISWEKLPYTLHDLCQDKLQSSFHKKAWYSIKSQLGELSKHNILHGDVHLKNIMVDKNKKHFYLIDYGLSSNPDNLTPIEKLYLENHQDQFQFLWNLVFLSNKQMNNYELFGNILRTFPERHEILVKTTSLFFPIEKKKKIKNYFDCFLKKDLKKIKTKREKIMFKFFLERLYLTFYILFVNKNKIYQNFIKDFQKNVIKKRIT